MWDSTALAPKLLTSNQQFKVNIRQSHISQKTSEMPRISCKWMKQDQRVRLSFKERRMKFREPTKPHRKSGVWGIRVRGYVEGPRARGLYESVGVRGAARLVVCFFFVLAVFTGFLRTLGGAKRECRNVS